MVAPTRVNGAMSSGIAVAPGPLPTMMSTRKSSIARYSISSAGRARRWISSMKTTSPSCRVDSTAARSPDRSIAGPLVIRSGAPSSAAMIIAIVVLPRPGGPESSTWSGGPAAAQRAVQQQRQLLADPGLADEVIEALGPQRALDLPVVTVGERRDDAVLPRGRPDPSAPARRAELGFLGPGQGVA